MPPENQNIPKIRTYKTDSEEFMKDTKVSSFDIASKAYQSQTNERAGLSVINYKKTTFIAAAIILFIVSAYFGYQWYLGQKPENDPSLKEPVSSPAFIQAEADTELTLSRGEAAALTNSIKQILSRQFKFGTANNLKIRASSGNRYADAQEFVSAMNWQPPQVFLQNIDKDFNALVTYQNTGNAAVFIFKTKDFTNSFASMLDWERGKENAFPPMWQSLKPFIDMSGIDPANLYNLPFQDDLIKNNGTRVFVSKEGIPLLGYAFFNKKFIIISTSRDAIELVLTRMIALPPQ